MKKISYILLIGFIFINLIACQNKEKVSKTSQTVNKIEDKLIGAISSKSIDTKSMTKLNDFSCDLDSDNSEEKIELYTSARRNENGEMLWDDRQNWLLVVWDGEKAYPVLSEYVQLGSVYFTVSNNGVGEAASINVIINTDADLSLRAYTFSKDKDGFLGGTVYKSKDTNFINFHI